MLSSTDYRLLAAHLEKARDLLMGAADLLASSDLPESRFLRRLGNSVDNVRLDLKADTQRAMEREAQRNGRGGAK
jgi:hypothetical protein